jgi:hypothetical protein
MSGPIVSSRQVNPILSGGVFNISAPTPGDGQPVALQLDANGNLLVNIASGGGAGGVQYVDGVTQATPTGNVTLAKNASNVLHALSIDSSGNLNVNLAAGTISGGNAAASPTGAAVPGSADYTGFNSGGNLVGVSTANPLPVSQQGSVAVTGTFFQATQPVSIAAAIDVSDRVARLLGHVTVDNASLAVTGTFFQATQPVSIASTISDDVTDRVARLLGHVTVDNASLAVTGTFFQATQPVSIAAAVDVSDRGARLLGVVYGSQGQQLKQTVTNFNSQVELATGGTLYDARQIRALTSTDVVTVAQATAASLNATVVFASPQHVIVDSGSLSITGTVSDDVTDRAARLLGHVTVDNASQAVTIVDGGSVTEGSISDLAVFGDNSGTVSSKLRGLNYQLQQLDLDTRLSNQLLFLLLNQSSLSGSSPLNSGLAGASGSTLNQAPVPVVPSSLQGLNPFFNGNLTAAVVPVKSYPGSLNGWMISNPNATTIYIQCFDSTAPVVLGTTVPSFVLSIPPSGAANILGIAGVSFTNGLQVAATTTYSGNTAPGTGMVVTLFFK